MKTLLLLLLTPAVFATETKTSISTETETNTWKRVDKSLSEGVKTAKKKFMDADDGEKKAPAKEVKKDENGNELGKVADSLNEAWDNTLKGVGKVLKTQQTGTSTSTSTITSTFTNTSANSVTVTIVKTATVTATSTRKSSK